MLNIKKYITLISNAFRLYTINTKSRRITIIYFLTLSIRYVLHKNLRKDNSGFDRFVQLLIY